MKGIMKTLEAVIAILTILSVYSMFYTGKSALPEFEIINWRLLAFNALSSLDDKNDLRRYVLVNDTATIRSKLASYIPAYLNYDVQICILNCTQYSISAAKKITSVEYLIAGDVNNFANREIILYMWSYD